MTIMEKSEILTQIGSNIKKIRQAKGLTQLDLVGRIESNIDTTNISRIEKGRTNATVFTLYKISNALDVPLEEICKLHP